MKYLKIGFCIAIGLLLMGFVFNQSIANQFLTKVNYIVPKENAPILVSITADAQFEPRHHKALIVGEDVIIDEVYTKVGDKVDTGMPLFKVVKVNTTPQVNPNEVRLLEDIRSLKKQLEILIAQDALIQTEHEILDKSLDIASEALKRIESLEQKGTSWETDLENGRNTLAFKKLEIKKLQSRIDICAIEKEYLQESLALKQNELNVYRQSQNDLLNQYINIDGEGLYYSQEEAIVIEVPRVNDKILATKSIAKLGIGKSYDAMDFVIRVASDQTDYLNEGEEYTFSSEQTTGTSDLYEGINFKLVKKSMIVENGCVQLTCHYDKESGTPLLYQNWHGTIEKTIKVEGITVPKRVILTEDGRYVPGQYGQLFVINTRKGVLGDEDYIEAVEVRLLLVGDYECSIVGLEKDASGNWPKIVMNLSHEIKSDMRVFVIERN
jgi:hypothetical protein